MLKRIEHLLSQKTGGRFKLVTAADPQPYRRPAPEAGGHGLRREPGIHAAARGGGAEEDDCPKEEITVYFQKRFSEAPTCPGCFQTGVVESLADGISHITGLSDVMAGEMVRFEGGLQGMVMDIEKNRGQRRASGQLREYP